MELVHVETIAYEIYQRTNGGMRYRRDQDGTWMFEKGTIGGGWQTPPQQVIDQLEEEYIRIQDGRPYQ